MPVTDVEVARGGDSAATARAVTHVVDCMPVVLVCSTSTRPPIGIAMRVRMRKRRAALKAVAVHLDRVLVASTRNGDGTGWSGRR
jgi:hypothetical protein